MTLARTDVVVPPKDTVTGVVATQGRPHVPTVTTLPPQVRVPIVSSATQPFAVANGTTGNSGSPYDTCSCPYAGSPNRTDIDPHTLTWHTNFVTTSPVLSPEVANPIFPPTPIAPPVPPPVVTDGMPGVMTPLSVLT